jgi:putative transcriptional regulator
MKTSDDQLAPGFLIAPPNLGDPNFDRSVVLLAVHEEDGSMGFIINRRADMDLHQLLGELEIEPLIDDRPVLVGGPVSGFSGFLLYSHEPGEPRAPGIEITPTLSVSPSRELLEAAARGELDNSFELLLGYAGWAPGQLDSELERGSWLHAAFDEDVLSAAVDDRWDEIFASLGLSPAGFMTVPGGAQA